MGDEFSDEKRVRVVAGNADREIAHAGKSIPPRCLSIKQAAHYLCISPGLLRKHGPSPIRIGNRIVYDARALDLWIDQKGSAAPKPNEELTDEERIARDKASIMAEEAP